MSKAVTGTQAVLRAIGEIKGQVPKQIAPALEGAMMIAYRKSQTYVPVEFGPLKASGKVVVEGRGFGAKAYLTYGGETAPYALYVHENLMAHHDPPTCAKFLERAVRETKGAQTAFVRRKLVSTQHKIVDMEYVK